jgi:hypothetical protein
VPGGAEPLCRSAGSSWGERSPTPDAIGFKPDHTIFMRLILVKAMHGKSPLFAREPGHEIGLRFEQQAFVDGLKLAAVSGDFDEPVEVSRLVALAFR